MQLTNPPSTVSRTLLEAALGLLNIPLWYFQGDLWVHSASQ